MSATEESKEKGATVIVSVAQPAASIPNAQLPQFSPALQDALLEVLPSTDPLDSPSFDPIAYINAQFPDESSLSGNKLELFLSSLRKQVKVYNDSIIRDIREHSCQRSTTSDAINDSAAAITALFNKMKEIKNKARESELMVQEICRDIRSLDNAKKHLTSTIRALRNLHMLVSAVGQLDYMVTEKQYRDAARLIRAIDDLFTLFNDYRHVDKIRLLEQSVTKTKELCKEQLQHEMHRLIPTLQPQSKPKTRHYDDDGNNADDSDQSAFDSDEQSLTRQQLNDACQLIEVLDQSFKTSIMLWFSSLLLEDYIALYSAGKEGASIESIDRRYAWCRRMIKNYDDTYNTIFPNEWEMPAFIATQFAKITKQQLTKLLSSQQGKFDVNAMIKGLTKTIEFERELTYNMKMRRAPEDRGVALHSRDSSDFESVEHNDLVENIKMKYADKKSSNPNSPLSAPSPAASHTEPSPFNSGSGKGGSTGKPRLPPIDFSGAISEAFTPYMGAYVELERKSITDVIEKIDREERWSQPEESKAKSRFGGSDDLFLYIKNSITRCSKLTRNQTFYQLYLEYRRGLTMYCDLLERHLPRKSEGSSLSDRELILVCFIVNTAEYCNETIPMLEQNIQERIDREYKESIDLASINENYTQCIHKAVSALVSGMFTKLNKVLSSMAKADWASWSSVGDESQFAVEMTRVLREEFPNISRHLSVKFLPFFCNQIAATFIPRYVDTIYRCKRIGDMGAQQMSLDTSTIKQCLLSLPTLVSPEDEAVNARAGKRAATAPRAYVKYVSAEMAKAEALLKTLVAPNERLILTFKALLPKNNNEDLYRIFTLRGLKKNEFAPMVDQYNSAVGPDDQIRITGAAGSGGSSAPSVSLPSLGGLGLGSKDGKGPGLRNFITGLGGGS